MSCPAACRAGHRPAGDWVSEPTWNIPLPEGARAPVDVFVNSVQLEPTEYVVEGRWIKVRQRINPKQQMGLGRRMMLGLGIGVYGDLKADVVDVSYQLAGRTQFATDVTVIPPVAPEPPSQ